MSTEEKVNDTVEKEQESVITMKQLLEAGVHFGHQSSQWNPAMKEYIYGARNGIHIIDLQKTLKSFLVAYDFVRDLTSTGKDILFVGTKKQAQEIIGEEAIKCDMPFVNSRWLGGTLTNFNTIRSRVDYMLQLKKLKDEGEFENLPKKEQISLNRELAKLEYLLNGIVNMKSRGLGDTIHKFTTATGIKTVVDHVSKGLNIPHTYIHVVLPAAHRPPGQARPRGGVRTDGARDSRD